MARLVTPVSSTGEPVGFSLTGGEKSGQLVTLVDDSGIEISVGGVDKNTFDASQEAQNLAIDQKVDISVFNTSQSEQDLLISQKVDTSTFNASQLTQDNLINNKVEISTFNTSQASQNAIINEKGEKPFLLVFNKVVSQAVANGTNFNLSSLLTTADVTNIFNTTLAQFNLTSGVLKLPTLSRYVDYTVVVTINGTYSGGAGTTRKIDIQLTRANDTIVRLSPILKVIDNNINGESVNIQTWTNSVSDDFSLNGIKLKLNNNSGVALTLTSFNIMIKAK